MKRFLIKFLGLMGIRHRIREQKNIEELHKTMGIGE